MQSSLYKKIGTASIIMVSSVFLSRVMGLLREVVIAAVGGVSYSVDAYQLAFILPEVLNHVAAAGFLSVTFIPIFDQYLVKGHEEEGWRVFSLILTIFGIGLSILILIAFLWAEPLVGFVAHGISNPQTKAMAVKMTRIILPAQWFFFTGGLFMAVQFAKERFFLPALAPLIYNLGIILGGLVLGPWIGMEGFAWGVLAGAFFGNFFLQWIGAGRVGMTLTFTMDIMHPDMRRYLFLTLPLILGLTMMFSTEVFFRLFGAYMPEGTIAALNYGLRITLILVGLFGQAVGAASFPFMSRLVAEGRMDDMNRLLNQTLRYLSLVIPFSILLIVLRHEVVYILFKRGHFDATATLLTSHLLPYLLIGAFAFSAQTIVVRGYYAVQNTLFPAIFGTIAVILSIPFYLMGMRQWGPVGVAMGVSFSAFLQVIVLYVLWNKQSGNRGGEVYGHVGKMVLVSVSLGIILEGFRRIILSNLDQWTFMGSLVRSLIIGTLFLSVLYLIGRCLKINEIRYVFDKLIMKGKKD
ncbi:MAG: murein biosynthesis integral membrane protein MurJ [Deltaproteobacteria bacterium]|nr:murein biosynthesis integral membrane protein MurJ [Deltaproteobacteria bacterium]